MFTCSAVQRTASVVGSLNQQRTEGSLDCLAIKGTSDSGLLCNQELDYSKFSVRGLALYYDNEYVGFFSASSSIYLYMNKPLVNSSLVENTSEMCKWLAFLSVLVKGHEDCWLTEHVGESPTSVVSLNQKHYVDDQAIELLDRVSKLLDESLRLGKVYDNSSIVTLSMPADSFLAFLTKAELAKCLSSRDSMLRSAARKQVKER